jgi:hypothetical protein
MRFCRNYASRSVNFTLTPKEAINLRQYHQPKVSVTQPFSCRVLVSRDLAGPVQVDDHIGHLGELQRLSYVPD